MKKKWLIFIFISLLIVLIFIILYFYFFYNHGKLILSFTFDDGYLSHYEKALPLLNKYNFTATEFIIAGRVGGEFEDRKLMNLSQIKELENAGWEIASHTISHRDLTKINIEEAEKEIRESKEKLQELGFNISSFAYPYGKSNLEIRKIVEKYYDSGRTITVGFNNANKNRNNHNLKAFTPNERLFGILSIRISTKNLCDLIKLYKNKNLWMIIVFHDVGVKERSHDITKEELDNLLKCINENKIEVKNIGLIKF